MTPFNLFAILLSLASVFGVINRRCLRLPGSIGVLLISLAVALAMLIVDQAAPGLHLRAASRSVIAVIDWPHSFLNGALSFLLFAGALQLDLPQLWARKFSVLALALIGTLLAVILFGGAMWCVFDLTGAPVPLIWCIVLGAILAPTDPVSVIGMLRRIGLPPSLQALFAGESLFNDGVGVVMFSAALAVATGQSAETYAGEIAIRFLVEAVGGGVLGLFLGWLAMQLLRAVADPPLELTISLALATGAFSLANALAMSGPIAVVTAGLVLATRPGQTVISPAGRRDLMTVWFLIDEVLNALLFLLIGFAVVSLAFHATLFWAVLASIPLALAVRAISVILAIFPVHLRETRRGPALAVLIWGGLRGGISVAMALGLPDNNARPALLAVCYAVVVFSIIVQGLTMEHVTRRFYGATPARG